VSCPFCMAMLEDGLKVQEGYEEHPVQVKHVVEIVADAIPEPVAAETAAG
jgi:Fe-S oxidoreductase